MSRLKEGETIKIRGFAPKWNGNEATVVSINGGYVLVEYTDHDHDPPEVYEIDLLPCEVKRIPKKP